MRTVVEEPIVTEIVDAETAIYPRLEDAFDALKWWLARRPDAGKILDDLNWIYKQAGNRDLNIPALVVTYTFDHNEVNLLHLLVRLPFL